MIATEDFTIGRNNPLENVGAAELNPLLNRVAAAFSTEWLAQASGTNLGLIGAFLFHFGLSPGLTLAASTLLSSPGPARDELPYHHVILDCKIAARLFDAAPAPASCFRL